MTLCTPRPRRAINAALLVAACLVVTLLAGAVHADGGKPEPCRSGETMRVCADRQAAERKAVAAQPKAEASTTSVPAASAQAPASKASTAPAAPPGTAQAGGVEPCRQGEAMRACADRQAAERKALAASAPSPSAAAAPPAPSPTPPVAQASDDWKKVGGAAPPISIPAGNSASAGQASPSNSPSATSTASRAGPPAGSSPRGQTAAISTARAATAALVARCPSGASEAVLLACANEAAANLRRLAADVAADAGRRRAARSIVSQSSVASSAGQYTALTGQASFTDETLPVSDANAQVLAEGPYELRENDPLVPDILRGASQQPQKPRRGPAYANMGKPMPMPAGGALGGGDRSAVYGRPSSSEIEKLIVRLEVEYKLPPGLLEAVCRVESDLNNFAVSWHSVDRHPRTLPDAVAAAHEFIDSGRTDVDLGICQRNFKWHRKSMLPNESVEDFFSVEGGLRWAANYLRILTYGGMEFPGNPVKGTNDWFHSVSKYNAWNNTTAGSRYLNKVYSRLQQVHRKRGISPAVLQELAALSPNGMRILRLNDMFERDMMVALR